MSVLDEIASAATACSERVGGAVVAVGRTGRGSGVVVADGQVLTNAHNLRDRTTTVTFPDGRQVQGSVLGVDVDGDLAVLEVDTAGAPVAEWAGEAPSTGMVVFTVANPGGRGLRATFGTVAAVDQTFRGPRGRRITGAFEHTAPLGRGSSGSPVVDREGRLVGINTHRAGDGFYLAVPADEALRERIASLARGQSPSRPRLGVGLAPSSVARRLREAVGLPQRDGLLVQQVAEGSPAAGAGLRRGDLVVEAAGRPILRADDLLDLLDAADPRSTLTLRVVRGTEEREVAVRLDGSGGERGGEA